MPAPRILPLGFIDRTTDNGAIIRLTTRSDSHNLRPETPATLRNPAEPCGGRAPAMVQVGTPEVVVMTIGINPEVGRNPGGAVRGPGTRVPRQGARKLRDKGMPAVEIAEVLEVIRASVYRYLSETEGNES